MSESESEPDREEGFVGITFIPPQPGDDTAAPQVMMRDVESHGWRFFKYEPDGSSAGGFKFTMGDTF